MDSLPVITLSSEPAEYFHTTPSNKCSAYEKAMPMDVTVEKNRKARPEIVDQFVFGFGRYNLIIKMTFPLLLSSNFSSNKRRRTYVLPSVKRRNTYSSSHALRSPQDAREHSAFPFALTIAI